MLESRIFWNTPMHGSESLLQGTGLGVVLIIGLIYPEAEFFKMF